MSPFIQCLARLWVECGTMSLRVMASVMSWYLVFGLAALEALAEEAPPPRFVVADVARVRAEPKERGEVVGLLRINARNMIC